MDGWERFKYLVERIKFDFKLVKIRVFLLFKVIREIVKLSITYLGIDFYFVLIVLAEVEVVIVLINIY